MRRFRRLAPTRPLRERAFVLLFAGRTISMLGSTIAPVALAFAVVDLTGSPSDLGLVLGASFVPQILFLVVGGVWADRVPRHLVMVFADLVGAAAQATLAVLLLTGTAQVWHVVCVAAVRGVAAAFFVPASHGVVPQTVSPSKLQQANAILGFSRNGTALAGAAGGGLLVAALGGCWDAGWWPARAPPQAAEAAARRERGAAADRAPALRARCRRGNS